MAITSSRRTVLQVGCSSVAVVGLSALALAGALCPAEVLAQGAPASDASAEDFF
jgi:hypothetical protein